MLLLGLKLVVQRIFEGIVAYIVFYMCINAVAHVAGEVVNQCFAAGFQSFSKGPEAAVQLTLGALLFLGELFR
ncbi:hypothetical protein D3C84_1226340 [compost metagenome]